ncbi:SDR family oxidoreductase [Streptomyces sp. NPDC057806]|uniref:SDR family oxidoreductase n=1 Tax=unclassified Streptomyces TaxID=2593676 RepID=UPI0036745626
MKIFIAGTSGAIGGHLVTQLVARGHEVVGTTRPAGRSDTIRALGAEPVIVDALDPDSVADAVARAEPEVIVHQLTALNTGRISRRSSGRRKPRAGCVPRAPTICWPPPVPWASGSSWRRATACGWSVPAAAGGCLGQAGDMGVAHGDASRLARHDQEDCVCLRHGRCSFDGCSCRPGRGCSRPVYCSTWC